MSSNVSFTGLASGLDTTSLIANLQRFNQARLNTLNQTVSTDKNQQTAFQGVQSRLQALETLASQLGQSQGSVFDNKTINSSDSSLVTAAAGTGAQTGVTSLKVLALAQANQIASQGFADSNSSISQGTFQISAGSQSATITIDSTNNTLSGLAQAINNAGIGVSASVVNTGSGDSQTQPFRLLLTSNTTGTASAIKITNNLGPDLNGAVQPNFSSSVIGPAVAASNFSGTSIVTANSGAGHYTGSANDTFTFTVLTGGTVGTSNGIQVGYTNVSGTKTGTLTLNSSDANTAKNVVDGVQVQFAAGSLTTGDQFSLNVFSPTIQAATNSQVQLGSGTGAIVVQNSSNTLTNLIPGVTLKLQSADPTKTVQLNVANDVASATTQITNLVNDYNDFASYLDQQTAYTPGSGTTGGTAGALNSVDAVRDLRSQVEASLLAIAPNAPSQANRLGALGITPDSNGQLKIDATQLNNVLSGNVPGVGFSDLKNLFGLQGQSSSAGVQFATGSAKTKVSTTPYQIHITQAATRAAITSASPLSTSTVIDGTNNSLTLSIDGKSSTITLSSGTYTPLGLAIELQIQINASLAKNGASATVSVANNHLEITSDRYGAASATNSLAGSALSALGFAGTEASSGTDVAGSFTVNGSTEAATGIGQILTGSSTNANTADLVVVVSLTPSQVAVGGTDSNLTVTRGLASTLDNSLKALLDPVFGSITLLNNQFTKSITDAHADVTAETAAMSTQKAALLSQFAALESVLSNLQAQGNLLTQLTNSGSTSSNSTSTRSFSPNLSSTSG